jgi:hypothetical protein
MAHSVVNEVGVDVGDPENEQGGDGRSQDEVRGSANRSRCSSGGTFLIHTPLPDAVHLRIEG